MSDLTPAQKEAYARADSTTILLTALEIRHSLFPDGRFRFANYEVNVTLTHEVGAPLDSGATVTYEGLGVDMREPVLSQEVDPSLTFRLDGVSGYAHPYVAAAIKSTEVIACTARYYQFDTALNAELGQIKAYYYEVRNIVINHTTLSFSAGTPNTKNQAFPKSNYTAQTNPGLL